MKYFKKDNYKGILTFYEELIPINNDNCHEYVAELIPIITPDNLDIIRALKFLDNRIKQLEFDKAYSEAVKCGNELFDLIKLKQNSDLELLKFIAKHPYAELEFKDGQVSQIMKVDFAGEEITLRDFCEYSLSEVLEMKGFKDKNIDKKWKKLIQKLNYD